MKFSKITIFILMIVLTITFSTISKASYDTVNFTVENETKATVRFGNKSYVERTILSKDLQKKEIVFQLKAVNEEDAIKPTGELMLVIDNSLSMLDTVSGGTTREDLVINSAKTLITNLLKDNDSLKIGVVSFSTNVEVSKEGTIEDAKLISNLSNDSTALLSAVSSIEYNGPRTDLDAGISLAKNYFTEDSDKAHRYIIVLTDGVPNVALDYDKSYYSDDVINKTKAKLQSLSSISDNVIVLLTGIADPTYVPVLTTKSFAQIIEEIFGTKTNSTIGKFYYITDSEIEKTITQDIYNDLLPKTLALKDIVVSDYFTNEIVDNFEFSYVKDPTHGTISPTIDKSTNSITWNIPELEPEEVAIVQYKLKLKTNYDESIVNKLLDTHTKLTATYANKTNESTDTPKVKLTEELPRVIPKAGADIISTTVTISILLAVVLGIRYFMITNKLNGK